jgi:hypothetical protein
MLWAALALAVLLAGRWIWWKGKQPIRYRTRLDAILSRHLPNLISEAPFTQFFIAERVDGPGFLQVAVTEANGDWRTVEFGLPETEWARVAFMEVDAVLRSHSFIPEIEAGPTKDVPRFLRLRLAGPVESLVPQMSSVLSLVARAFGWGQATEYVLTYNHTGAA